MSQTIPIEVKKRCLAMRESGMSVSEIYNTYFKNQLDEPQSLRSFATSINRWSRKAYPDRYTLDAGTYDGFIAHDTTVRVSKDGEIVEAWIKQKADSFDTESFLEALKDTVEPYNYEIKNPDKGERMLEIPLFDMHWGIADMEYYAPVLDEVLDVVTSRKWDEIVIPFGQDFFHNDSIVNGTTARGTVIEKVDMKKAVKEAQKFMFALIDNAIRSSESVKVIYTPGNHDPSISWMFIQVLLERYGSDIVDDSFEYRKVIVYGKNAVMITHGDAKKVTSRNLASIFPIAFPNEFSQANVREIHAGHLHHEGEQDTYGVMVRRLSTGGKTDGWSDREDFIGAHKRFMLFEWSLDKLNAIHYI